MNNYQSRNMKELINGAENIRAKLLEVMLNIPYDFEPDYTIAITQAADFLKKLIERKDNIVDVGEVWHDITEEPKLDSWFLGQIGKRSYDTYISAIEGKKMIEWFDGCNIKRWAYIDDLLPKGGE